MVSRMGRPPATICRDCGGKMKRIYEKNNKGTYTGIGNRCPRCNSVFIEKDIFEKSYVLRGR